MEKTRGQIIRGGRELKELTQAELGKKVGVNASAIGMIERGERSGLRLLLPLASELDLSAQRLWRAPVTLEG